MAKPCKEGKGWAFRLRVAGQDIYRCGFKSEAQARRAMLSAESELNEGPAQSGLGPHRTSLGVAFSDYARERLPYLKGAAQDARRINRYLRALKLPVVDLTPVQLVKDGKRIYWDVAFVQEHERAIPGSLTEHRTRQSCESAESDLVRTRLATMMMADVTTHHVQGLINALRAEGKKSATVHLERSELRRLFKHARAVWKWRFVGGNPAGADLDMPEIEAGRDRVVTNDEWQRLSVELAKYPNPYVAPLACLMLETAMRSCEPLVHLRWRHINWQERVLELSDAKAGGRKVPLGPGALHILTQLREHAAVPPGPDDKLFPTTYEAVKKAWAVAREAAGVHDVGLHDLRHTSATRFALEFKGNLPVLMIITGHKTAQMAMRYVNIKSTEVATMMHGEPLDVAHAAAGYQRGVSAALDDALETRRTGKGARPNSGKRAGIVLTEAEGCRVNATTAGTAPTASGRRSNVVVVDFGRRAA